MKKSETVNNWQKNKEEILEKLKTLSELRKLFLITLFYKNFWL